MRDAEPEDLSDVLQEHPWQSDPRTTARYCPARIDRRQRELERVYGALSFEQLVLWLALAIVRRLLRALDHQLMPE
jgi:hypothetical protein